MQSCKADISKGKKSYNNPEGKIYWISYIVLSFVPFLIFDFIIVITISDIRSLSQYF